MPTPRSFPQPRLGIPSARGITGSGLDSAPNLSHTPSSSASAWLFALTGFRLSSPSKPIPHPTKIFRTIKIQSEETAGFDDSFIAFCGWLVNYAILFAVVHMYVTRLATIELAPTDYALILAIVRVTLLGGI
ncbi:hypothetical protein BCR33DRAFT_716392 [Rhizoclosmatium globosum]|uniref:Uncharacterized protein n=1 Tax=Rhizoclosmatium globosum TaxID=329046 RepID=A0A1Y2CFB1_9FUNG|nr:hypothetical protein BCR33DRAFT_716392 [Rhizoclosmatium globosum]|eukprot:ORY45758.1 hypothetical protein BCR33DRAFT_716392 [Rhizoclosmatium globosum]